MIEVKDARKWIQNGARRVEILKGISLIIPAGQFVAIVGASGSGKSTLLGLLAGLDTPSSGEIWLDGVPIHNLAETQLAEVRGKKIGFVFQSYQLIPTLTALENVLLPYELNLHGSGLAKSRRLLEEVGLSERVDHYPMQLSGGEQQRVAIARAFVVDPPIVMADEPTGNLDSTNGKLVLDLLLERNRKAGTTLVLVTHDPEVASRADRSIVLRDGLVVEDTLPYNGRRWAMPDWLEPMTSLPQSRPAMAKRALSWKRAAAIGWRDLKSAPGKFGFVVLSVAVGVAALVGVRGFSESFRQTLGVEARSLMAGDLSARLYRSATDDEKAKIARCREDDSGSGPFHLGYRDNLDGLRSAESGSTAGLTQGCRSGRVSRTTALRNSRPRCPCSRLLKATPRWLLRSFWFD